MEFMGMANRMKVGYLPAKIKDARPNIKGFCVFALAKRDLTAWL
jgi:hypothetical protein